MQDQTVDQGGRPGGGGTGPALGVLAVAGALVPRFTDTLTGSSLAVDGSQSAGRAPAERAVRRRSDRGPGGRLRLRVPSGERPPGARARSSAGWRNCAGSPASRGSGPYETAGLISADGRTALAVAGLTGDERERQKTAPAIQDALDGAATDALAVDVTGSSPLSAAVVE